MKEQRTASELQQIVWEELGSNALVTVDVYPTPPAGAWHAKVQDRGGLGSMYQEKARPIVERLGKMYELKS